MLSWLWFNKRLALYVCRTPRRLLGYLSSISSWAILFDLFLTSPGLMLFPITTRLILFSQKTVPTRTSHDKGLTANAGLFCIASTRNRVDAVKISSNKVFWSTPPSSSNGSRQGFTGSAIPFEDGLDWVSWNTIYCWNWSESTHSILSLH